MPRAWRRFPVAVRHKNPFIASTPRPAAADSAALPAPEINLPEERPLPAPPPGSAETQSLPAAGPKIPPRAGGIARPGALGEGLFGVPGSFLPHSALGAQLPPSRGSQSESWRVSRNWTKAEGPSWPRSPSQAVRGNPAFHAPAALPKRLPPEHRAPAAAPSLPLAPPSSRCPCSSRARGISAAPRGNQSVQSLARGAGRSRGGCQGNEFRIWSHQRWEGGSQGQRRRPARCQVPWAQPAQDFPLSNAHSRQTTNDPQTRNHSRGLYRERFPAKPKI